MKISNLKLSSKDDTKPAVKRLVSDSTQKESSIPVLPPDYLEATQVYDEHNTDQSPNIIAGPHPRLTRPTNYLTLIREDSPIRGTFKVDPTLAIPPGAIISKDRHGKELNLKFGSTCGMVEVCVEIVRGIVTPMHMGPARLEVASIHCDVIATIVCHERKSFSVDPDRVTHDLIYSTIDDKIDSVSPLYRKMVTSPFTYLLHSREV